MKARAVAKLAPERSLAENAARIVRVRLDELRSFVPAALQRDNAAEQHDMRIAAKRLRYVLEATGFTLAPAHEPALRAARKLQEVLGELHDCDEMGPRVDAHLGQLRRSDATAVRAVADGEPDLRPQLAAYAPNRTAYRGLEVLAAYLEARRLLLFDRFAELWADQQRDGVWDRLEDAAAVSLERARGTRRSAS